MLKYFPGIVIVQVVTAGLVLLAVNRTQDPQLVLVFGLLGLVVGSLAGFLFSSISRNEQQRKLSKIEQTHASEREQLKVNAERQKNRMLKQNQKEFARESRRVHARANFKVSVAFSVAVGVGALMLFTQFVTVGLMVLLTSGGAMAGYLTRMRQEHTKALVQAQSPTPRQIPPES